MQPTNIPNVEAFLNICANTTEILGVRNGAMFIVASLLLVFLKEWKASRNWFLLGFGTLILGLGTPNILNWMIPKPDPAAGESGLILIPVVVGAVMALVALVVSLGVLYVPVYIAKRRGKERLDWIIGLSGFSIIIALLWSISLFLAYKPVKALSDQEKSSSG